MFQFSECFLLPPFYGLAAPISLAPTTIEDLSSGVVSGFIEKCMSGTERLDFISSRLGLGPPLFFLLI